MKDSSQIRMNITSMEDIKRLEKNKNVKYVNIDIMNPNLEVIYHLIDHGQKYSYSERMDEKNGYIYVSHDIFKSSQFKKACFITFSFSSIRLEINCFCIKKEHLNFLRCS